MTWQALVVGRTDAADVWLRTRPSGDDAEVRAIERLALVVMDNGRRLEGPRFLQARLGSLTLVGGAWNADQVTTTMTMIGNRRLYTFVGWASRDERDIPSLARMERHWADWARPQYELHVGRDWGVHRSKLGPPPVSPDEPPPWAPELGEEPVIDPGLVGLTPVARRHFARSTVLLPQREAGRFWYELARSAEEDFVLSTGWLSTPDNPARHFTHLATLSVDQVAVIDRSPEAVRSDEPELDPKVRANDDPDRDESIPRSEPEWWAHCDLLRWLDAKIPTSWPSLRGWLPGFPDREERDGQGDGRGGNGPAQRGDSDLDSPEGRAQLRKSMRRGRRESDQSARNRSGEC